MPPRYCSVSPATRGPSLRLPGMPPGRGSPSGRNKGRQASFHSRAIRGKKASGGRQTMFFRAVAFVVALMTGMTLSQVPEFAQQYRQRLGGAIDELALIITHFDEGAT